MGLARFHVSLDLPREAAEVGRLRRTLDARLAAMGVADTVRADISLALSEACSNAVAHANEATHYHVDISVNRERCMIDVIDDGGGFDPSPGPTFVGPRDVHGRGLMMARAVSDQFALTSVTGVGSVLRFTKRLHPSPDPGPSD